MDDTTKKINELADDGSRSTCCNCTIDKPEKGYGWFFCSGCKRPVFGIAKSALDKVRALYGQPPSD